MDLGGEVSTWGVSIDLGGEVSTLGVSYRPGGSYQPGGGLLTWGLVIDCCFKMGCTNHPYTPFRIVNGC